MLVAVACCALAPSAAASSLDQASAHKTLLAFRSYLRSAIAQTGAGQRAADGFVQAVAASCPNVLAAVNLQPVTTQNKGPLTAFGEESAADIDLSLGPPLRPALAKLDRKVRPLRWSSRAWARRIGESLTAERRYFYFSPSDFCGDARQLAANNAQATPPSTLQFLAGYGRVVRHAGFAAVTDVVARFERRSDRALVNQVIRLNRRLMHDERAVARAEIPKLLAAVGLTS